MRPLTVRELSNPVRRHLRELGFKLSDRAESALTSSGLLPENTAEAVILAKLAGLSPGTVLCWLARYRTRQKAIQAERLQLLGDPSETLVFIASDGSVCGDRQEALEASCR